MGTISFRGGVRSENLVDGTEVFDIDGTYRFYFQFDQDWEGEGWVRRWGGANYPSRSDGLNSISFYRRTDHLDVISFLNHISS